MIVAYAVYLSLFAVVVYDDLKALWAAPLSA